MHADGPIPLRPGTHKVDPNSGSMQVLTYREGMAQKVGHDLIIDVTGWEATVDLDPEGSPKEIALEVDPRSLRVREGLHGVKPLTDKGEAGAAGLVWAHRSSPNEAAELAPLALDRIVGLGWTVRPDVERQQLVGLAGSRSGRVAPPVEGLPLVCNVGREA